MNTKSIICLLLIASAISCSDSRCDEIVVNQTPMKWRYDKPATKYWEGMPIGTGRFAAMIPGALGHEVIPFNDETLFTGGPYNPVQPGGTETLQKVREYIFAHDYVNAEKEAWKLGGFPTHVQLYQPMGRLNIDYGHTPENALNYTRELNMEDATVGVAYQYGGVKYERQVFASYPDQVVVVRLKADKKGKINFSTWFTSLQPSAKTRIENGEIVMEGATIDKMDKKIASYQNKGTEYEGKYVILPPQMRWQSRVKVVNEGGSVKMDGARLTVCDANAVTIILAGATNWVNWNDVSADEKQRCSDYITNAAKYSYKQLLKRHLDDYRPLFAACKLNLGADPLPQATTTQAMDTIKKGFNNPAYTARYFQFGRYLLLAGAREGTLAFNNHNIWLDNLEGRWQGRWTLNINIQECYWPVENTNLPCVNESLLLFVENLAQSGQRTASELFGCRGWCGCHGADVWFNTAPQDGNPQHATWPMAGPWLMQQLYSHYEYNPDTAYLRRIYPLMQGSTEFLLDWMVKDPETGYLGTAPSSSPENRFFDEKRRSCALSFAAAGDIQLIRNQLRNFIEASEALGVASGTTLAQAKDAIKQLPPHKIGKFGQLQEWFYDFDEPEPTHRHTMHLIAFYPDDDITLRKTPELADAVRVSLKRRKELEMNFGWAGAWKIAMHARLEEPEKACFILHKMEAEAGTWAYAEDSRITPSYEGNQAIQGVTAGMAEMLLQ
ncbi:MAG: glycoside hydrolase N-terminal domain-containing protein, partial [Tannerella sp.]|nr:glycoside hydrolase N-terminal domain-containing protein [Tannerella sp.]